MAEDQDIMKKVPDPVGEDEAIAENGEPCIPSGAAPAKVKGYWYIVQPEDLSNFWRIPEKFNLPTSKAGGGYTWHELRNANFDWKGGFVKQNGACVLSGLFAGAKLNVPADWPEPRPGVQTETKKGGKPTAGTAKAALIVGVVGLVGIGVLGWMAHKQKKGR